MFYDLDTRILKEAEYIVKNNSTVRATAKYFGVSKSTVHYDMTKRLKTLDEFLYVKVRNILFINLCERHIRGGLATKRKFNK